MQTQTTQPTTDTSQLDPSVIALMHGLKMQEGGGKVDYNAIGDMGTAAGAGQWSNQPNGKPVPLQKGQIPYNFQADAKQYGLNPNDFSPANQNQVMYKSIASDKEKGLTPEQILSKWNSGDPNAYQSSTSSGTGPVGKYNVAQYVSEAMKYAQQYSSKNNQSNSQSSNQSGYNPTPFSNPTGGANQFSIDTTGNNAQPSTPTQQPENLLQKAGDVAKGVGNFLFPIVGDIGADIQGKSTKTALQQTGDAALSVLPFIPGLGEAGEAVKGGEAAIEGGEAAADAAKGSGVLSKLIGSPVAKGAGVGYGAGVASNLSQGQGIGQAFTPNLNNIGGAVLGGAAPAVLKGLGGLADKLSGVDPQVLSELKNNSSLYSQQDLDKFMGAAKGNASNFRLPNQFDVAGDDLDNATSKLEKVHQQSLEAVGQANKAGEAIPLASEKVSPVADAFNSRLDNSFGIKVVSDKEGNLSLASTRPGAVALTPIEKSRILDIASRIDQLGSGNVRMADDLMTTLDKKVDYGTAQDPLQGIFKQTRGMVNQVAREASPDFAAANDRASALYDATEQVKKMAGNENQRGIGLMKRVFSGDKSGETKDLFNMIQKETGVDLQKSATLAKYATDAVGSKGQKSLLQKALIEAGEPNQGMIGKLFNIGKHVIQHTVATPEAAAKRAIGSGGVLSRIAPYLTKGAIEAGSRSGQ